MISTGFVSLYIKEMITFAAETRNSSCSSEIVEIAVFGVFLITFDADYETVREASLLHKARISL